MSKSYDPRDWYWLAEDGRLFASARITVVTVEDAGYRAWLEAGGPGATGWPRDEAGAQTEDALQEVLTPYGLFAGLSAYAAARRYAVETSGITVGGSEIATDRGSQALITGAFNLVTINPKTTIKFKASGTFVTLDASAVTIIATEVGQHVQACFAKEADVVAGITVGTIKTLADIDAAFASLTA